MGLLESIETAFRTLHETGSLERRFESWSDEYEGLADLCEIGGLISLCRDPSPDPRKDAALAALCVHARKDQTAGVVLCWLLLPGLWEAVRDLPTEMLDPGELAAELLAGLWTAAASIDERTRGVPGHLANGARWSAQRGIRKAIRENSHVASGVPVPDRPVVDDLGEDLLTRAVDEAIVSEDEIELLLAARTEISDLARRHSVSVTVLQARRKRARARLAVWVKRVSRDLHAWERPALH